MKKLIKIFLKEEKENCLIDIKLKKSKFKHGQIYTIEHPLFEENI